MSEALRGRFARIRLTFAACLALAAVVLEAAEPTAQEIAEQRVKLQAAYTSLEAEYRAIPRESFEPSAILLAVGREDTAILAWVRAETFWVPYQGLLKGGRGVLADRVGNSLDRSILLAELLEAAGYKVRLARARLSDEEARTLLSKLPPVPDRILAGDCTPKDEKVVERVKEHAAALETALGNLLGNPEDRENLRLNAARDHWWVERQAGEKWSSLDPDAWDRPLREKPEETHDVTRRDGQIVLPADLFHEVGISLVLEVWDSGKLVERPVLKASLRPSELFGRRVTLGHHPMSGKAALLLDTNDAIKKVALAEKEWLPVLLTGDRNIAKASFDDAGNVHANPNLSPASKVGAALGGLLGGLGAGVGGETEPGESATVLTAEWIDFEIRSPGCKPRVVRREIFDLLGPAVRVAGSAERPKFTETQRLDRALTLAGFAEWLLTPCQISWAFARYSASKLELDQRPTYLSILAEPDKAKRLQLSSGLQDFGPLLWSAVARRNLNPARDKTYLDTPNVIGFHVRYRVADDGRVVGRVILDMTSCHVVSRGGQESLNTNLFQGVADAAAEGLVLQDKENSTENTLDVLEAAARAGSKLLLLRGANDPALKSLALPPDTKVRLLADLTSGYVAAIPEKPLEIRGQRRIGWWRVDVATGDTVAVMDTGYHQDLTEEAFLENDTVVGRTLIRNRIPRTGRFWNRHPGQIARDMGYSGEDMNVLNLILDLQNGLLRLGLL